VRWSPVELIAGAALGVLLGAGLTWAVWSGLFGSRPHRGRLLDLDLRTGAVRFDVEARTAAVHVRALGDGLVVVSGSDDCSVPPHHEELYAYAVPSGTLQWHRRASGTCSSSNPGVYPARVGGGVNVVGTPPGPASNTATYTARDQRTGRVLWRKERRSTIDDSSGQLQAVGNGLALFVQPQTDTLEAFALRSGALRWRRQLPRWMPGGSSQVVADAGAVAVIGQDEIAVLDARTGRTRWSKPLSTAGLRVHAPAAIRDEQILIPSISSGYTPVDE
jgi:outer membrane protein assembly factor BamB